MDTHNCVFAEVARRSDAARVVQEDHVVAKVCTVRQTAEGYEQPPGQEGIHRACGHSVSTQQLACRSVVTEADLYVGAALLQDSRKFHRLK